jgi:hypothetical protein
MWNATNDTLLLDAPVVRGERPDYAPPAADRTADLARIVRHALRHRASASPLDRALRSAVQRTDPAVSARMSEDEDLRVRQVARQMNALLAQRAVSPPAGPHRETVRH